MTRVAVLGTGAWGLNHVRIASSTTGSELVAMVDVDRGARDRASACAPAVPCLSDPDRILTDRSIEAVVIATASPSHAALAIAALDAGKHVLVEKPLALSMVDARRISEAQRAETVAMVGHLMVFHPAVVRLRELVRAGEVGEVQYVRASRAHMGRVRADESVLWSLGPHELSMLDHVLGWVPETVSASGRCVASAGVEDVVVLDLRYPGGALAQLHLSRCHARKERVLTVIGASHSVELDELADPPLYELGGQQYAVAKGEPLRLQFEHFLHCVRTRAVPRNDLASALRVTRVLDAAQRSLATGQRVRVATKVD